MLRAQAPKIETVRCVRYGVEIDDAVDEFEERDEGPAH
jgi:hypothetical protein